MRLLLTAVVAGSLVAGAARADPAAPSPAALGTGPFHWDFEAPGRMHDLAEKILHVAWSFLPLALVVALAVEAFGRPTGQPRDFAAVLWRTTLVSFLLLFYLPIFNGLMKEVFDPLADAVTPVSGFGEFLRQSIETAQGLPSSAADQVIADGGVAGAAGAIVKGSGFGGFFFDSLVSLLLLVAEGLVIVIGKFGKVLAAFLFCLGPLALVASVPRPSRTGTRWFGHFVTILSWPVLTGLLLSILVAMGRDGADTHGYLAAVIASLLTTVLALAIPRIASQVVGGTLENLVAMGLESARRIHRDTTGPNARHAFRSVFGGPEHGPDGGTAWRAGLPVRAASAFGSVIANGLRPRAPGPSDAEPSEGGGAIANPPHGDPAGIPPKARPPAPPRPGAGPFGSEPGRPGSADGRSKAVRRRRTDSRREQK